MSENQNNSHASGTEKYFFRASASDFRKIPGSPIAYNASKNVIKAFSAGMLERDFTSDGALKTGNNANFIRFHWEISSARRAANGPWRDHPKGGDYRKWSGNRECVVLWTKEAIAHYQSDFIARILDKKYWDLEGISWSAVTSGSPSFRLLKKEDIANNAALCIFPTQSDNLYRYLGYLNSRLGEHFIRYRTQTLNYLVGDVIGLPRCTVSAKSIDDSSRACIQLSDFDWNSHETSWDFTSLPLLHSAHRQPTLKASYQKLRTHWREMTLEMQRLEQENNRIFIEAYDLKDELDEKVDLSEVTLTCNPHYRYGVDKTDEELENLQLADTIRELVSYAVGCMLGRYSLDKPGLVLANQGETLADYLAQVPQPSFSADDDNVIPVLDGDWFADDITLRFRQFLRVAFGEEHYEDNLAFIEQVLNVKGKRNYSLRNYFLSEFYADHVKRYKKRPIYWLFSSPKGSFNALIYMHRYRPDTVSVVLKYLRDYRKKLVTEKERAAAISINSASSQDERIEAMKKVDRLGEVLTELEDYERDTLYPLATGQVQIDLDDGVKVNYRKFGIALKKIAGLEAKDED